MKNAEDLHTENYDIIFRGMKGNLHTQGVFRVHGGEA